MTNTSTPVVPRLPLGIRPGNPSSDRLAVIERRRTRAQRRHVRSLPRDVPRGNHGLAERRRRDEDLAAGAGRADEGLFARGRWVISRIRLQHREAGGAAVGRRDVGNTTDRRWCRRRRRRRARQGWGRPPQPPCRPALWTYCRTEGELTTSGCEACGVARIGRVGEEASTGGRGSVGAIVAHGRRQERRHRAAGGLGERSSEGENGHSGGRR